MLRSIFGAAFIAGLCIYFPATGIRGALFCLFPGMATRSSSIAWRGAIAGFFADISFDVFWTLLGFVWEPRASFNRTLSDYLPPDHHVGTHQYCPVSNELQFGIGLVGWCGMMFAIWLLLIPHRFRAIRFALLWMLGVLAASLAAAFLWIVSPMDEWWHHGAQPFGDIESDWFIIVFLSVMPICCLIFAAGISLALRLADPETKEPE